MGSKISLLLENNDDYVCLTDLAKFSSESIGLVNKWIRNKNTLEFIGVWEKIHIKNFNYTKFGIIKNEAGTNRFMLSIKVFEKVLLFQYFTIVWYVFW